MAVVNVYYLNTTATTPNWFGRVQDNGTAPGGATGAGWTVGKTAVTTPYFRGRFGATTLATAAQASSYIDSTSGPAQGTGSTGTTAGDSFRSDNPLNGTFAAGNWNFTFGMRAPTPTTVGRIRLHVWASVNASGASARKLNTAAGTLIGTIVTMSSATTTYNSTVTWAAPSIVLANEYLFTQIEWQETTAGTANGSNAQFYQASFVTPDYVYDPATGTLGPTEVADTAANTGTVAWLPATGTMDTLETTDTLDFSGDVSFIEYLRPDGDASLGGWTDQADGTSNIYQSIDETAANDTDYVQSPLASSTDLKVRLFDTSTQIAEWTHTGVADTFTDAVQTLTAPQVAAISNYANLFLELDDNSGNVYRAQLSNPSANVTTPIKVKYRYKKIDIATADPDTTAWVNAVIAAGGTVSSTRQAIVDTFIKALKASGTWDTLDRYWLLANENTFAAGIDIRHLQPLVIAGAPSFVVDDGYLSTSNTDYVNSNYNPALHAVNYTKNSATVGGQVQTVELTGGNIPAWGAANLDYDRIANFLPTANTNTFFSLNSNTNNAYNDPAIVTRSSWVVTRNGPGANTSVYRNGVAQVTDVGNAATDVPDGFFIISGGSQGPYMGGSNVYRLASFFLASGWSSIRIAAFENDQNAMMTAIGCNVH